MANIHYLSTRRAYDIFLYNRLKTAKSVVASTYSVLDAASLATLNSAGADITVGIPYFFPCKPKCKDCTKRFKKQLKEYKGLSKKYPKIKWSYVTGSHLKSVVVDNKTVFIGGRNISNSRTNDGMVMFDDIEIAKSIIKNIDYVKEHQEYKL